MKSKTSSSKKKLLFVLYNNSLLESWTNNSIQNPTTSSTTSSWDIYLIFPIAEDLSMTMNFQPSKNLSWAEQALLIHKTRTSKIKTISETINITSSPQPPVQTVGDNISAANQSAASNDTSAKPRLATSAIPYNNN